MSEFTIRAAKIGDAPGIADTSVESWNWAYAGIVPAQIIAARSDKSERENVVRRNWKPERAFLVATNNEERVLGFVLQGTPVSFPGYDCEIAALYVHPIASRQGVGQALVAAIARIFVEIGYQKLCLHTLRENRIGRGFYDKLGGRVFREDDWSGVPAVWYGWDDVSTLIPVQTPSE